MTLKGFISIETYVADVYRTSFFLCLVTWIDYNVSFNKFEITFSFGSF